MTTYHNIIHIINLNVFLKLLKIIVFKHFGAIWDYRFRDCRLILEQSGNLKYLYITASYQRLFFRSLLITISVIFIIVTLALSYHIYLQVLTADLTHSNSVVNKKKQMALEALAAASDLHPSLVANMSNQELKEHAERMR